MDEAPDASSSQTNSPSKDTKFILIVEVEEEESKENETKAENDPGKSQNKSYDSNYEKSFPLEEEDAYGYSFSYANGQELEDASSKSDSRKEQRTFQPSSILFNNKQSYIPINPPVYYVEPVLPPSSSLPPTSKATKEEKFILKNQNLVTVADGQDESSSYPDETDKSSKSNKKIDEGHKIITTITKTETILSPNDSNEQIITTTTQSDTKVSIESTSTQVKNILQHQQLPQQQQDAFNGLSEISFEHGEKVKDNNVFIEDRISIEHIKPTESERKNELSDHISTEYAKPSDSQKENELTTQGNTNLMENQPEDYIYTTSESLSENELLSMEDNIASKSDKGHYAHKKEKVNHLKANLI